MFTCCLQQKWRSCTLLQNACKPNQGVVVHIHTIDSKPSWTCTNSSAHWHHHLELEHVTVVRWMIYTRVMWTREPMHQSAARSVGVQFYVSLSPPLFAVGHFDNTIVPYRQPPKLHFKNMIVPYQLPRRLMLRNMAVRLTRNYTCIFTMQISLFGILRHNIQIHTYSHTHIHTYRHHLHSTR